jgi:hypothetical protein
MWDIKAIPINCLLAGGSVLLLSVNMAGYPVLPAVTKVSMTRLALVTPALQFRLPWV